VLRSLYNVFGKNASDKSCKISKKYLLFTNIQFDLSTSAGSDQGHIHVYLMKYAIFIADSNTQLLLMLIYTNSESSRSNAEMIPQISNCYNFRKV